MKTPSCESNRGRNANSNWQIPQPFYQAFALQTSHMKQKKCSSGKEVVWDLKRPDINISWAKRLFYQLETLVCRVSKSILKSVRFVKLGSKNILQVFQLPL